MPRFGSQIGSNLEPRAARPHGPGHLHLGRAALGPKLGPIWDPKSGPKICDPKSRAPNLAHIWDPNQVPKLGPKFGPTFPGTQKKGPLFGGPVWDPRGGYCLGPGVMRCLLCVVTGGNAVPWPMGWKNCVGKAWFCGGMVSELEIMGCPATRMDCMVPRRCLGEPVFPNPF